MVFGGAGLSRGEQEESSVSEEVAAVIGSGLLPELEEEEAKTGEAAAGDTDTDCFLLISFTELLSSFICSYRNF